MLKIQAKSAQPYFKRIFHHEAEKGCRHASAFGGQGLIWFEGSKEAVPDVKIRQTDLSTGHINDWFDATDLTKAIAPHQAVRVLGNTIGLPDDKNGFIATTVSVGGWSGLV